APGFDQSAFQAPRSLLWLAAALAVAAAVVPVVFARRGTAVISVRHIVTALALGVASVAAVFVPQASFASGTSAGLRVVSFGSASGVSLGRPTTMAEQSFSIDIIVMPTPGMWADKASVAGCSSARS